MGFESEDTYAAELRAILRIAHALRDFTGVPHQPILSPITGSLLAVIDSINLPTPCPLLPLLLHEGFNHEIAAAASEIYRQRAEELRQDIQQFVATAWRHIAKLPVVASASFPEVLMRKFMSTFTELYMRRLELWKEDIIQRLSPTSRMPTKAASNFRTFKQEYIPLLEHFFGENPFPTHADKVFFAQKSNMTYRQIHVWFQNRRNRTKKDSKVLRKKPTFEEATKPLNKLHERKKGHGADSTSQPPDPSQSTSLQVTIKAARSNAPKDVLVSFPPPHAFPSSYPPTCHYEPFPCKSGTVRLSKPEWRRVPHATQPPSISINIDDLAERFSRLSVRGETRHKGPPKLKSHAATSAITVVPSRAPHPALIIPKYRLPTNAIQLHPTIHARIFQSNAFQTLDLSSEPVTSVPSPAPPNKSEVSWKRKVSPLPQRFPGRRNRHRDTMPSDCYSTSSSPSRLSFAGSDGCSSSSSVSSLSTPPDAGNI